MLITRFYINIATIFSYFSRRWILSYTEYVIDPVIYIFRYNFLIKKLFMLYNKIDEFKKNIFLMLFIIFINCINFKIYIFS